MLYLPHYHLTCPGTLPDWTTWDPAITFGLPTRTPGAYPCPTWEH